MLHARDYTFILSGGIAIHENVQVRGCRLETEHIDVALSV